MSNSRLIVNVLGDLDLEFAWILAARSAKYWLNYPNSWADGAIATYSEGWATATYRTKTGYMVKVWKDK